VACTPTRQAPGGWRCRASASRKISRLVRMCSIQRIFGIGRHLRTGRRMADMKHRLH
jgi:hypothetical protein